MKRVLLAASACIGLFAFTSVGTSSGQQMASVKNVHTWDTTGKPKPDSSASYVFLLSDTTGKPKPDSIHAMAFLQTDTTGKPKPDSIHAMAFLQTDTTGKPKPDSMSVASR